MTAFANYEPRCITLQVCAACKVQLCSRFTQNPLTFPWWMFQTDLSFGKTPPLSTTYISLCRDSVCSAARLNEAAYVSLAHMRRTQLRGGISSQRTLGLCAPNVPKPWEYYRLPGGLRFITVRFIKACANFCLRDPHQHIHKHTCVHAPNKLDKSYENSTNTHSHWRKKRGSARRGLPAASLHQSSAGPRLPVIRSMRYVVGMWDFFSFFSLLLMKDSLARRNGFAGLLWSLLYDSFICFSHIPSLSRTWRNVFWIRVGGTGRATFSLRRRRRCGGPGRNRSRW